MENYISALTFYTKSLEIKVNAIPTKHPDLATINYHIGDVHIKQNELEKGFTFLRKS